MILAVIEKRQLWEMVLCLSLFFAVAAVLTVWMLLEDDKEADLWPTLYDVAMGDRRRVERWLRELPAPVLPAEHKVYNEIAHRILVYNELAYMDSARPTAESMTCKVCGRKHPFVHVFGKCGSCMEKNN